eukprot:jgi/Chlat1/2391/Chrsp17S02653
MGSEDEPDTGEQGIELDKEYRQACDRFVEEYCTKPSFPSDQHPPAHHAVEIYFSTLAYANVSLADHLLNKPRRVLPIMDEALQHLASEPGKPPYMHARIRLPELPGMDIPGGQMRSKYAGRLIALIGTVIRAGAVHVWEAARHYGCNKCKHKFKVANDPEVATTTRPPARCPAGTCLGKTFTEVGIVMRDHQELVLKTNHEPVIVLAADDLAGSCRPGDQVRICGALVYRWAIIVKDKGAKLPKVMEAVHVEVRNNAAAAAVADDDVAEFEHFWSTDRLSLHKRNTVVRSVCPQLKGLWMQRLTVALALAGGSGGPGLRAESHILLVGDPGSGKSQLLRFAQKAAVRAVAASGTGVTSAGLTCAAVKGSGGEWELEAGALVLADGGICLIDEFEAIRSHDRPAVHEAMEQQTLSVAKAGIVTTLSTRTTVIAATNFSRNSDDALSLSGPLLSRFDLVLPVRDKNDSDWDRSVSSSVLSNSHGGGSNSAGNLPHWPLNILRRYLSYVRSELHPVLTEKAECVLAQYYQLQRRAQGRNAAHTTVRLLEGLIRLTQAHARLMFRKYAVQQDAVFAVLCVDVSLKSDPMLQAHTEALLSDDAEVSDIDDIYEQHEPQILQQLGLSVEGEDYQSPSS